jgi:hypothetical protein
MCDKASWVLGVMHFEGLSFDSSERTTLSAASLWWFLIDISFSFSLMLGLLRLCCLFEIANTRSDQSGNFIYYQQ